MPSTHAALIVDADPKGLEALVYGFQGAEWRMTACPAPETASLLVKASGAEILVVASRSEHEKTLLLVRQLRATAASRKLPVLVLGPEEMREPLKEEGEAELLPLPAFVRDVLTASELLVAARISAARSPGEDPRYDGAISSGKTLSLVRTMNALGRSGHLRLAHHGRYGDLMFHEGELTAASAGPLQGMAAVQHLMIWNDGKLDLRFHPVPRRGQLHLTTADFLQEMDRFQREIAHAMKEIGPASAVYSANQERLKQAAGGVPAEVTPVIRLCNGSRPLADVIDESPFRVLDTVRILGRLAELGVLTRGDGKPLLAGGGEDSLETARIEGAVPPRAWPMPAPIGGFPLSTPIQKTAPTPPPKEAAKASEPAPEPARQPPQAPGAGAGGEAPADGRPRRQTREIGIPAALATPPAQAAIVAPPAAQDVATPPPVAPAPSAPATRAPAPPPGGALPATPAPAVRTAPMRFAPLVPTPAPVVIAPTATSPVTPPPAQPATAARASRTVTPRPVVVTPPPSPTATIMQASGAFAKQPGPVTPPPSPTATIMQASGALAAKAPPASAPAGAIMHAAGVIDSQKHARKTKSAMPAAKERRSVVIEAIAAEDVVTPPPSPQPAPATRVTLPGIPSPPAPAGTAPVAGEMHVAPSRRTATQVIPAGRVSIQLDTSLTAGPPAQTPQAPAPIVTKPEPQGSRVTGEMHVPPSGRSTRSMAKAAPKGSSFHIDPSLSETAAQAAQPRRSDSQPAPQKRTDSRPVPPRRSDSRPTPGPRHQSGSFSTVETDFFDREADLYKEDKAESFADLDEGQTKGKPGAKGKGGKPGRPYRK
jgi:hypothetical protein